jgi:excinuclease ABC subunit A
MDTLLQYYTLHSPLTDPGPYTYLYDGLPDDLEGIFQAIQGVLLHRNAVGYFKVDLTSPRRAEIGLRTMQQRLAHLCELDEAPLVIQRDPADRQIGLCRDFALFLTSILRHKGLPARMRVGFAAYFPGNPFYSDHWITEYWLAAQDRWVLADADVGGMPVDAFSTPILADLTDLRPDQDFYVAGSAWLLARAGKVKSTLFRYSKRWKGFPCIRGNLLHDFQALNRLEMRIFDYFDDLHRKPEHKLTLEDKALLDQIARLTCDPQANFEPLRSLFDELPRTRQVLLQSGLLALHEQTPESGATELKPSGADRLTMLAEKSQPSEPDRLALHRFNPAVESDELPGEALPGAQAENWQELPGMGDIVVRGARQHNLKNITVRIPRYKMVVVTGVSGSGKSSLAFDTIYAEGQRRYVESLSSFARQFMEQMEKPQVDQIIGLNPAIAIEQKALTRNPRSTVGTVTEVLDYLRVLFARLGVPHCPQCGQAVMPQGAQQMANQLSALQENTHFQLLAPVARYRKGAHVGTLKDAMHQGFSRARVDGQMVDLAEALKGDGLQLDKNRKHNIELVVDRLVIPPKADQPVWDDFRTRLMDSVETCLKTGDGVMLVSLENGQEIVLSEHNACGTSFSELQPPLFSFNSPIGMCDECNGLGFKLQVDPDRIITQSDLSLLDGASPWYGNLRKKDSRWHITNLRAVAEHYQVDLEKPWNELPEHFRQALLFGSGGEKVRFHFEHESDTGTWNVQSTHEIKGVVFHINRLFRQTKSEGSRRYYLQYMSQLPCPKCHGERLCPEARFVTVGDKRLPELTSYSIAALHDWVSGLESQFDEEKQQIAHELIQEIRQRLGFIRNVGLHYLTLDRSAPTLSGGEGQRIRLASQIGSGLVGVLYILDEPSIGLHARDHRALLDTLIHLRDLGNTVLVVEHDPATMLASDWIIDLGPGPGILGGELVAEGTPEQVMANPDSLTGRYLSGELKVRSGNGNKRRTACGELVVRGARLHNLKNIDVRFPLGTFICITGVSGSGKSSLIAQTVYPALSRALHNAKVTPGAHDRIDGLDLIDKVINITQDPIGRNPRSNPGTYVGVLDEIRKVFASVPEAKALGYTAGRFSFNVKGGRCEACAGYGYKKVEMHFLPDVWVTCKECSGKRFNYQTLQITYKGKNIADILDMDVQEALEFFAVHRDIARILRTLHDVGLDYIKLGQSALTLSGGEAQRIKLAKELSRIATGKTIYILDEPTTGLHFADIQHLLDVLNRLVDAGNTVVVIEHNLDVIRSADWIIDLGPEGGEKGGYVVTAGTPEQVMAVEASYTGKVLKQA